MRAILAVLTILGMAVPAFGCKNHPQGADAAGTMQSGGGVATFGAQAASPQLVRATTALNPADAGRSDKRVFSAVGGASRDVDSYTRSILKDF